MLGLQERLRARENEHAAGSWTELIKKSVCINTAKKEARAWLAFSDDLEEWLTENKHVALKRLN